jgi:hypothetical protein
VSSQASGGTLDEGNQKFTETVLVPLPISPALAGGALMFANAAAAVTAIKKPNRIFPSRSVPRALTPTNSGFKTMLSQSTPCEQIVCGTSSYSGLG